MASRDRAPGSKAYRKRSGAKRFLFLQFLNIVVLGGTGAALVFLHDRYTAGEARNRAAEVARYELRRLVDAFNLRLNVLREELLGIHGEQAQLARALGESERERLLFYRRDHLAAYGILVQSATGDWEIQKYFVREAARKEGADPERIVAALKSAMSTVKPPGFGLQRVGLEPRLLGAGWGGGQAQALEAEAYAVAFASSDDTGKPFGVVGIFRPSYVFPFCKAFGDALGLMPVSAFVINDKGVAVCHSQVQNEGMSYKDYSFYPALSSPPPGGIVRYANLLNNDVSAAVKRVDAAGLVFASEAVEVSPWASAVPYNELGMVGAAAFFLIVVISVFEARTFVGRGAASRDASAAAASSEPLPATDGLGVELGEFTKLRHEVKELEGTLLEMQAGYAFVAAYQLRASSLPPEEDLARSTVDALSEWGLPVAWLAFDEAGRKLHAGPRTGWGEEVKAGFQLGLPPAVAPLDAIGAAELRLKLEKQLGRDDLLVQPVVFGARLRGAIVIAGVGDPKAASKLEHLPHIAQSFAMIAAARESGA